MPTYQLECQCGYTDTVVEGMHGPEFRICPSCDQQSLYRLIGTGGGIGFSTGLCDKSGEKIWWPKGEKSYFDPAFNRKFDSPQQKKQFMDENNFISAGSMDSDNKNLKKKFDQLKEESNGKGTE